jgi:hypothetical protein
VGGGDGRRGVGRCGGRNRSDEEEKDKQIQHLFSYCQFLLRSTRYYKYTTTVSRTTVSRTTVYIISIEVQATVSRNLPPKVPRYTEVLSGEGCGCGLDATKTKLKLKLAL